MKPNIFTFDDSPVETYPVAIEFAKKQQANFWLADEYDLSKDVQFIRTELSEAERHGLLTVLRLFTLYEIKAANFWLDVIPQIAPRQEIISMASMFGAMEASVHRLFYQKINELLFLHNNDFYSSWKGDPVLEARMQAVDKYLGADNHPLVRIAAFAFIEGSVLFSSFAYIMSYRANGRNAIANITAGIRQSISDEDLHSQGACWLFQQAVAEYKEMQVDLTEVFKTIYEISELCRQHEEQIISLIFAKGKIPGITEHQFCNFVESRNDKVLERLGLEKMYNVVYNPVAGWFNKLTQQQQVVDFFHISGASYSRGWSAKKFIWTKADE